MIFDDEFEWDEEKADPYNLPDDFWENGVIEWRDSKEAVSIRLDSFVLDYFKRRGPGYQSRINAVLRHFVLTKLIEEAKAGQAETLSRQP
jgi:uncharacterized protein (DUF4415 family)